VIEFARSLQESCDRLLQLTFLPGWAGCTTTIIFFCFSAATTSHHHNNNWPRSLRPQQEDNNKKKQGISHAEMNKSK
jgi:hypothetical protein